MSDPIISNKALAKLLRAERKRHVAFMRNGDKVTITTHTVIVHGQEAALWDAVKVLPGPIPNGDGKWALDGTLWRPWDVDVTSWLKPFGRKLEDTKITLHNYGDDAHLFWDKNRYVAIREEYLGVFTREAEFFWDNGRIQVRLPDSIDVIGVIAPLYVTEMPRFIVPADEVKALAETEEVAQ